MNRTSIDQGRVMILSVRLISWVTGGLIILGCLLLALKARAKELPPDRPAVWAGQFYPADATELGRFLDALETRAKQSPSVELPPGKSLRAVVMPHAGYPYSGWTAAHAGQVLRGQGVSKVVLLAPDHRLGARGGVITDAAAFRTPLGRIPIHPDTAKLLQLPDLFQRVPVAVDQEHAVEVVLPYLQKFLPPFQLIPVVVGPGPTPELARAIESLLDAETLLVVSSDLSHELPDPEARERDRSTIDAIVLGQEEVLRKERNRACGAMPLLVLLDLARRHHWKGTLLHASNSGDTTGDRNRVVGYATIAFMGETAMTTNQGALADRQGQLLVRLARQTLADYFGRKFDEEARKALDTDLADPALRRENGTFVTLKIDHQLRGCIGNLGASGTLVESVKRNALSAALHDTRFRPLTEAELDRVRIEVSVLTEPAPLSFTDAADLTRKLRPGVDGVILRKGAAAATFLPQVWEQLPRVEDFLAHLCTKAGLPADAWKRDGIGIHTYQVQYFEESGQSGR